MVSFNSLLLREPTDDQKVAIDIITQKDRYLLADSTGLGKTYTVLSSYVVMIDKWREKGKYQDKPPILFVSCPRAAVPSWNREIKNYTKLKYKIFTTETKEEDDILKEDLDGLDVVVIPYFSLRFYEKVLSYIFNYRNVVFVLDEIHLVRKPKRVKNTKSGIVSLNVQIKRLLNFCKVVWGLTATPLLNHIEDLYYVINMISPGYLGTLNDYMDAYAIQEDKEIIRVINERIAYRFKSTFYRGNKLYGKITVKEVVGHKNLDILVKRLKDIMLMRFQKVDLSFNNLVVSSTKEEMDVYLKAAWGILEDKPKDFAARLPDLQLVVNNAIIINTNKEDDDKRELNVSSVLSNKEKFLVERIQSILKRGVGVIVYTCYHKSLDRIKLILEDNKVEDINRIFVISGKTSTKKLMEAQAEFSTGDVILMTDAGGKSLNLQAADTVVFYDVPFSIGNFIQIVGRVTRRDTKHKNLFVDFISVVGTIDEYKTWYLLHNADLIVKVMGGNANLPPNFEKISKADIVKLRKDLLWKVKNNLPREFSNVIHVEV